MPVFSGSPPGSSLKENLILGLGARAPRILGAIAAAGVVTFACTEIIPASACTAGFFYLAVIWLIGAAWGLAEASAATALAFLCFDYFFVKPFGASALRQPEDVMALASFLVVALFISFLSSRRPRRESSAGPRQEMESLYALSRAILLTDPAGPAAKQIAFHIARIFQLRCVALYDRNSGEIAFAGPEDMPGVEEKLRAAAMQGTLFRDDATESVITAVRLGGHPIGSVALRGITLADAALHSLTNLVAIGLEKVRGQEAAARAEVARESQELKSTLLDAIAHEFKTPLTSIKAAATALLAGPVQKILEQRELISIVDEEADRLGRLVSEAIQMARIEASGNQMARQFCSPFDLVEDAIAQLKPLTKGRSIQAEIAADLPAVLVDADLLGVAIRQLIDNALKFSPPDAPVTIRAASRKGEVTISVLDQGPGIPEGEVPRIFEKFYRSPASSGQVLGTGMGLAIARKIVEAHTGSIMVRTTPGRGTEFVIALPAESQEAVV